MFRWVSFQLLITKSRYDKVTWPTLFNDILPKSAIYEGNNVLLFFTEIEADAYATWKKLDKVYQTAVLPIVLFTYYVTWFLGRLTS